MYHTTEVLYPSPQYRGVKVCHLFDRDMQTPLCGVEAREGLWVRRNARIVDDLPTCPRCMRRVVRPEDGW